MAADTDDGQKRLALAYHARAVAAEALADRVRALAEEWAGRWDVPRPGVLDVTAQTCREHAAALLALLAEDPMTDPGDDVTLTEVSQTILASDESIALGVYGNCMQAAMATLLDKPLDAVPHFGTFTWWPGAMRLWLRGLDLDYTSIDAPPIPQERALLVGKSPRGISHMVVSEGGQMVWDPHPSRDGLSEVTGAILVHPWEPDGVCWVCHRSDDDPERERGDDVTLTEAERQVLRPVLTRYAQWESAHDGPIFEAFADVLAARVASLTADRDETIETLREQVTDLAELAENLTADRDRLAAQIDAVRAEGAVEALREAIDFAHEERRQVVSLGRADETMNLFVHWSAAAGWLASRIRAIKRGDDPNMPDAMRSTRGDCHLCSHVVLNRTLAPGDAPCDECGCLAHYAPWEADEHYAALAAAVTAPDGPEETTFTPGGNPTCPKCGRWYGPGEQHECTPALPEEPTHE